MAMFKIDPRLALIPGTILVCETDKGPAKVHIGEVSPMNINGEVVNVLRTRIVYDTVTAGFAGQKEVTALVKSATRIHVPGKRSLNLSGAAAFGLDVDSVTDDDVKALKSATG